MFQIKICGVTTADDARLAAAAGAEAIGLNFYAMSPRYLSMASAEAIAAATEPEIEKVGVFVNAAADEVLSAWRDIGLNYVQLHGDESPEFVAALTSAASRLTGEPRGPLRVIRAFRCGPEGLAPVHAWLNESRKLAAVPALVMLDAWHPTQYGGTGRAVDRSLACQYRATAGLPPLVLAGGLTPDNVAEAIRLVNPAAVDTASGVESAPGRKDASKVAAFVAAARAALASANCPQSS